MREEVLPKPGAALSLIWLVDDEQWHNRDQGSEPLVNLPSIKIAVGLADLI